jgi:putative membrane protein
MNTHKSKIIHYSLLTGTALCLALFGLQNARADDTGNRGQLTSKDFKFVTETAQGGKMEVSSGQLAQQKASDPAVKDFAQRMVTDHTKANDELKDLLTQKGVTLPDASNKSEEKTMEHYQSLSGADFDKAYMKDMVSDHKKTVKAFQKASEKSDDADLKSWTAKTLPTLQDHLRMAESVEANLNNAKPTAAAAKAE